MQIILIWLCYLLLSFVFTTTLEPLPSKAEIHLYFFCIKVLYYCTIKTFSYHKSSYHYVFYLLFIIKIFFSEQIKTQSQNIYIYTYINIFFCIFRIIETKYKIIFLLSSFIHLLNMRKNSFISFVRYLKNECNFIIHGAEMS